ncbi:MAG: SPOR domain-containing protein [Tenuifilaceae bacterium]
MKRIIVPLLLLTILVSGCKFFTKKDAKSVDTTAAWQAKQDSISRIEAAIAARESATQDSLRQVQEMLARFRFHVIIGSFKVPTNADDWQQEVTSMGFSNPTIVESTNGYRMVSVGSYETYSKAFTEIKRVNESREESIDLWIYEVK